MTDDRTTPDGWPPPLVCSRCVRAPRDPADRAAWVTLNGHAVCPGCVTANDRERLRFDADH